ncbi:uncharacterized protein LOC129966547 [Argiope bruennichi]|uniref:EB domain-containing protein n=1 Tax=Argiope bruennichi TaxID=94029 RepID=A0A8T0E636_ARGBR|nr:uncharacterized protein LOC129966547 [Argiope bruennichi]XP_055936965.1 uncharacterized protein LOC129966547 [Argiope bruennichi]XP_055936966.1 uncharacterized protein LOC129966547 [Argiope bruennichi]KAF8766808.1 hypothetical protein HNY73_019836 [Argiope bruennichi]
MKIINFYGINCLAILFILLLQVEGQGWSVFFGFTELKNVPGEIADELVNITCTTITDCTSRINGSLCTNGYCNCPEDMPVFVNATAKFDASYCLPALNLTEKNCTFSQQCRYDNALCFKQTCLCAEKYIPVDGNCKLEERTAMIPIIVGSVIGAAIVFTLISYFIMSRKKDVT